MTYRMHYKYEFRISKGEYRPEINSGVAREISNRGLRPNAISFLLTHYSHTGNIYYIGLVTQTFLNTSI